MTQLLTVVIAQSPGFQVRQTTALYSTQFWIIAGLGVAAFVGGLLYLRAFERRGAEARRGSVAALRADVEAAHRALVAAAGDRQDDDACDARAEAEAVEAALGTLEEGTSRQTERRLRALREALTEARAQL